MTLIPTLRCRNMRQSLAFYAGILDFERVHGDDELSCDCGIAMQRRALPNNQMEPTRLMCRAIMVPSRAAHLERWASLGTVVRRSRIREEYP